MAAQEQKVPAPPPAWGQIDEEPPPALPEEKTGQPEKETKKETHPSALEKMYSQRAGVELSQYGYDLFTDIKNGENSPMGAVQDNFVLGAGDELLITFTGQRTDQATYKITPDGNIIIKDIPPLPAAGKSIAQLRALLNAQLSSMHNTQSYVSLSSVRQIGVLVLGHVKNPGRKSLSAFNSALDALNIAGGITKDGSLRQVKLVRAGTSHIIDLYDIMQGSPLETDISLRDGDRIIIPPIGSTIAVSGAVKRPGIYEIRSKRLSLDKALRFAGEVLIPGQNRFIRYAPGADGQEDISEIKDLEAKVFSNGTILSVMSAKAKRKGTIELTGETRAPGLYDLSRNKKLSDILENANILGEDIYPLLGIIERWDAEQLSTRFISFPLRLVLKSKFDISLADNDVIRLFSNQEIKQLFDTYESETEKSEKDTEKDEKPEGIFEKDKALKIYLKEHSVHVRGAILRPGHYPVAQGINLKNVLAVAGGATLEANMDSIEITSANFGSGGQAHGRSGTQRITVSLNDTSAADYMLSAGDSVRVNQKYRKLQEKTVRITGEVMHPGEYDLLPGDTVLSLIERAGGLTQQAYAPGAIFSRESERRAEELRFRKAANDMQRALATAIENDKEKPGAAQIEMVRSLAYELENIEAVGRITIEADPAVLTTKPELNMLLENGDRLFVPRRPLSVRVSGEVLSPSALQFIEDKSPLDYINQAGGFTFHADKNRTFVLYPDGSAQPLQVNTWNHKPVFIPPGSTIVVPRDPKPFDFIEGAREIGQILSNLAVTAVFIDDIRD